MKVARIALIMAIVLGGSAFYQNYRDYQLRIEGSGTIPISSSAIRPRVLTSELETASQSFEFPSTISTEQAAVSFNHNPSISYGTASPPYDPENNSAYDFVWETVEKLELGSSSNPLDELINAGDTVLIKPNWVDFGPAVFTRPEVVRPLIDMAIAAGATEIYVGDGGGTFAMTEDVMSSANYTAMVSELNSRHPGIDIETVNLNALSNGWHWISLGSDSSFAGSGYSHYDLGAAGHTLSGHNHYSTSDPQGINPGGETLGWYAVNDIILDADVIINVPKMKTHQLMIATMSIKDLVGCTIGCTYDEQADDCQPRIPHHITDMEEENEYYFSNHIFWRAILDMNKILTYADKDGVLQPTQQRMYLNVVDGIQAMEKSAHHVYGGGGTPYDRHVVLASVDPAATDAVGCRIMGYDYSVIPSISNANSDTVHPIGTNDPEDIVIIGDTIGSGINHVFTFNSAWSEYAGALAITDFTPPIINSIDRVGNTVTASVSSGLVAYILYQMDGTEYVEKMSKDGDTYSGTVPDTVSEYQILAQDRYFNTAQGESFADGYVERTMDASVMVNEYVSVTLTDATPAGLSFGDLDPGTGKQAEASSPSITITTAAENNQDIEVYLKGDNFIGGAEIFSINQAFYNDTNNPDTASAMSNTYGSAWKTLGSGETLDIYHWLSIPPGTMSGSYESTFTYKTQTAP